MKYVLLVLLLLPVTAMGQTMTGVSGDIDNGTSVTISGTGLGSKSPAWPLIWDNFESGVGHIGAVVDSVSSRWNGSSTSFVYTSGYAHSGSVGIVREVEGPYITYLYPDSLPSSANTELYMTGWMLSENFSNDQINPVGGLQIKLARMNYSGAGAPPPYNGPIMHNFFYRSYGDGSDVTGMQSFQNRVFWSEDNATYNGTPQYADPCQWQWNGPEFRWEAYAKLNSDNSTADGIMMSRVIGLTGQETTDMQQRRGTCTAQLDVPLFEYGCTNAGLGGDLQMSGDDFYADITRRRLELTNSATWGAETHSEIQPCTSWGPTGITFLVNTGSFATGATAYLHAVDEDDASIASIQVTVGAGFAPSGPLIQSAPSSFQHGGPATISGAGFGVKSPAAPLRYDNFEGGTLGERLPDQASGGWYTVGNASAYPSYSQDRQRLTGETCALQDYSDSANQTIGLFQMDVDTLYVSGWTYRDDYNGTAMNCENVKFWGNFTALTAGGGYDFPQSRLDTYWATGSGHLYCLDETGYTSAEAGTGTRAYLDEWFRLERYMAMGDSIASNGHTWASYNLDVFAELNDNFYTGGEPYTHWLIGQYFRKEPYDNPELPEPHVKVYWSELYVDITQARVEIGDAATWSACTHREIQIPTAWSDSEITVSCNAGTLASGADYWLYVVDRDGVVSPGYPVSIVGGTPPAGPTMTATRSGTNASVEVTGLSGTIHYQIDQAAQQTNYVSTNTTVTIPFGAQAADVTASAGADTIRADIDAE